MPTTLLIGPVHTLVQNTWYAMPARSTRGYASTTQLEVNVSATTSGTTVPTVTAGEFSTAAPFIRTIAATATIRLVAL